MLRHYFDILIALFGLILFLAVMTCVLILPTAFLGPAWGIPITVLLFIIIIPAIAVLAEY